MNNQKTNLNYLQDALGIALIGFRPVMIETLKSSYGANWWSEAKKKHDQKYNLNAKSHPLPNECIDGKGLDFAACMNIAEANYKAFTPEQKKVLRYSVKIKGDVRNFCAHPTEEDIDAKELVERLSWLRFYMQPFDSESAEKIKQIVDDNFSIERKKADSNSAVKLKNQSYAPYVGVAVAVILLAIFIIVLINKKNNNTVADTGMESTYDALSSFDASFSYYESAIAEMIDAPKQKVWTQEELEEIRAEAVAGNTTKQLMMGFICRWQAANEYEKGNKEKATDLWIDSLKWAEESAIQGDTLGMVTAAIWYHQAAAISDNTDEWLSRSLTWAVKAAEAGDASGQVIAGLMYYNGLGTNIDYEEAAKWYTLAANQGDSDGQVALGTLYFYGQGVTQEYEKAFELFEQASKKDNNYYAQYWMGVCFEYGYGTSKSLQDAYAWYLLSATQGYSVAQDAVGRFFEEGIGVDKNYEEAVKWYKLAADQGNKYSQCALGYLYFTGNGVEQDYDEAFRLFTLSSEQGFMDATAFLSYFYCEGISVERDTEKGIELLRTAASDPGMSHAQADLGYLYWSGHYVDKDENEALKWFKMAEENGAGNVVYLDDNGKQYTVSQLVDILAK